MNDLLAGAVLLAGPTASGKSDVALDLAGKMGGEIISVDSMQVYRGMDIGTAKPSPADRARVAHHLIDVAEINEPFDASQFTRLASATLEQIRGRGKIPILCGGTGLYFQALWGGLGTAPRSDPALRAELASLPLAQLQEELATRDPALHKTIDVQNPRRLIRALEVIRLTGRPFSEQRSDWSAAKHNSIALRTSFLLSRQSSDLNDRISARVDSMFEGGLIAETESLLSRGLDKNQTAIQALGYKQVIEYLRAVRSLPQTIELVKIRTRQFAKRQRTWFARYGYWNRISIGPISDSRQIADQITSQLRT